MATLNGESDILAMSEQLKERLENTRKEKEKRLQQANQLNDELQHLFSKIPKKPRENMEELDDRIKKLEYKRTTQSMALADEKKILYEIVAINKTKVQLKEYIAMEEKIQEKKKQLNDTRDTIKVNNATIDELDSAIGKCKLAEKLGCTADDLQTISVDTPQDKIGRIIGKNGATIKQIEQQNCVSMDVDSVTAKIHLTGTHESLEEAVGQINKIIAAIDDDYHVSADVITYLLTKRITTLEKLKENHPDVVIEIPRDKGILALRGAAEQVEVVRQEVAALGITKACKDLGGKEAAVVIGKSGVAINKLIDDHQVAIDVSETGSDEFTVIITGPSENVEEAMEDITSMLEENKDVVEELTVEGIFRNMLLLDGGAPIRKLQKEVSQKVEGSILITFDREVKGDEAVLQVKGRRNVVLAAKEAVEEALQEMKASIITINIDPYIVPIVIGKGGKNITELRKDRKTVNIEVDKTNGVVTIHSHIPEEAQEVEAAVNEIVAKNQVKRIDFDPTSVKTMFREILRSEQKDKLNAICWFGLDDDNAQMILRGTKEQLDEATDLISEFMETNFVQEIEISAEDEPALLVGGNSSAIRKLEKDLDVSLNLIKSRYVLIVKGERPKVETAVKRVKQFLHGGDGHTVSRITVTKQALGVVIGKGGSKRTQLEETFAGVSLFIHDSNKIIIRGPEEPAKNCRIEILKLISSARVQETVEATPEQLEKLSPEKIRQVTDGIPVQVKLAENNVTVRGFFPDVRDALIMVKEVINGYYEARVDLVAGQLSKVRGACRDPSHFERIRQTTKAKLELDMPTSSIVITGKRGDVRKAKSLVMGFLEFLMPSDFARLKIPKPLYSIVGDSTTLSNVAAISGAAVILDRDLGSIQIQSANAEQVKAAVEMLRPKIEEAEKLAYVLSLDQSEAWMIPMIIGKGGNVVNGLRMESGCEIDVNKESRTVTITGEKEEDVTKAKGLLNELVEKARRECTFVDIPADAVAPFLGRGGANIKNFANDHKVEIERMRKEPTKLKITGTEEAVASAKKGLAEWVAVWEEQQADITMPIDKNAIPAVLGKQGATISSLQKDFKCKVDINRDDLTVSVRGASQELRQKAMEKIKAIIAEDKAAAMARSTRDEKKDEKDKDGNKNSGRNGAAPAANGDGGLFDGRKDRSSEFAAHPVGLTIVENGNSKKKKKKQNGSAK